MGRVTGSWLSGPRAAYGHQDDTDRQRWRGERLGLPESGSGAAAPTGRRALGFFIDLGLAALVAGLFTAPELPGNWSLLAWILITIVPVGFFGFTPGMAVTGIWVSRLDGAMVVGVPRALLRCLLTLLLVPAVLWNLDGRSWHDRLTGTVVLRR
ncbi:RDD family protein [Haloactinomyces albus]|uniref:RDD family membrane protein YckC n=1 Tax=Haloactinomyces albus TaxID=1352928 RepID=A0AAE4CMN8_9ACTN|nr:RDD family protein [Haloactinomyces albus]MDR7303054.1 putative RDD family membrane protein YckC [Haloactinomyces albus]